MSVSVEAGLVQFPSNPIDRSQPSANRLVNEVHKPISAMESNEETHYNQEPETNNPDAAPSSGGRAGSYLVSEKTEDVTVDTGELDKQESGLGEQNHGDDFLGKANKEKE